VVEVAYVRDQGIVGSFDPHVVEQKGNAPAVVATGTVLEVKAPDSGQVTFAGPTGTLWLGRPSTFIGKVADFRAQESIDLPSIPSAWFGIWRGQSAPARMRAFDGSSSYEQVTVGARFYIREYQLSEVKRECSPRPRGGSKSNTNRRRDGRRSELVQDVDQLSVRWRAPFAEGLDRVGFGKAVEPGEQANALTAGKLGLGRAPAEE
jgi:hypothetical protein